MEAERCDISVVVPSYMQGDFLGSCLSSILEQKGVNFEILVFDGGSTDRSLCVLESMSRQIDYWESNVDLGQAHAINKGLALAKGNILCFLNSDDVLEDGALARVVRFFDEKEDIDLLYGRANYIDRDDNVIGEYRTYPWNVDHFLDECIICQPAAFWRRRVYERIGGLDRRLKYSMDYDYWIRVLQSGGVVCYLDDILASSRDYPETKTRSGTYNVYLENFRIQLLRLGWIAPQWIAGFLNLIRIRKKWPWCLLIPASPRSRRSLGEFLSFASRVLSKDLEVVVGKRRRAII